MYLTFVFYMQKKYIYIQRLFNNNTRPLCLHEPTQASIENRRNICIRIILKKGSSNSILSVRNCTTITLMHIIMSHEHV